MYVEVDWTRIKHDDDPLWRESRCLYAYVDPETGDLVYIGKADWQTVRQRLYGEHKDRGSTTSTSMESSSFTARWCSNLDAG